MKVNKHTLLWAAKASQSVSEMAKKLGRDEDYEERLWGKMLRLVPGAEDFLERNEAKVNMKLAKANGDDDELKEHRLTYIAATIRLVNNQLINNMEDIVIKPTKSIVFHQAVNQNEEDLDSFPVASEVPAASEIPADILDSILNNN